MQRVLTGRDKFFTRLNVGRWMREHGGAAGELVGEAARAFGVEAMMDAFEPGDACNLAWVWDVAAQVAAERGQSHVSA